MQFTVTINQAKALEWGLNSQQALLFAFVYECPSWARLVQTPAGDFYALSKAKILEELPLLTDKPDTAYRLLKQIAAAGVIDLSSTATITLVRLTAKGQEWNRKLDGSEKYPTQVGEKSEVGNSSEVGEKSDAGRSEKSPTKIGKKSGVGRKKIRSGSEKSPTNQVTSNQVTSNQVTSNQDITGEAAPAPGGEFVGAEQEPGPRCQIPADMPGPKDPSCKTYRTWANYAMAYRRRYSGQWPVWNKTVAGVIGRLVDRLGQADAPKVAAFFVGINDARLINACHPVTELLRNAEGYRTQWASGRQMNATTARQLENTQANINAAQQAAANIRAGGSTNAFLRPNR
ncbi:phage replication protein [Pseudomonas aeruginosa]|uniref:phage replication protein n=1 Tax=Pseudomonas aeruginosa TaxID=287 RepID=UPI000BB9231D|nr:phage replication protein [Pseudomonas aeruginosa]MBV6064516.1 phage replication protein [Pseudomonas aeruginosa]MBV6165316.1 phage replication protein [Pseudomonas aeruginosa]MBV6195567.1 phage replication protein [Pseudomonas aeruginosa]PBY65104.1 phage replication protein [Pseudomonas aeruginosa]